MNCLPDDVKFEILNKMDCRQLGITKLTNPELSYLINLKLFVNAKIRGFPRLKSRVFILEYNKLARFNTLANLFKVIRAYINSYKFSDLILGDLIEVYHYEIDKFTSRNYLSFIFDGFEFHYIQGEIPDELIEDYLPFNYWPDTYALYFNLKQLNIERSQNFRFGRGWCFPIDGGLELIIEGENLNDSMRMVHHFCQNTNQRFKIKYKCNKIYLII